MNFNNIGVHNLYQEGFDAVQFSLLGMGLVFSGLIVIALYIIILPKILNFSLKRKEPCIEEQLEEPLQPTAGQEEILLAIATALHLQQNFPEGSDRITWKSHGDMESPWLVSGRMHSLAIRKHLNSWRRK